MEGAILETPILIKNKRNSLECTCEKLTKSKNGKIFTLCDVCSEKSFLRNTSDIKFDDGKISCLECE